MSVPAATAPQRSRIADCDPAHRAFDPGRDRANSGNDFATGFGLEPIAQPPGEMLGIAGDMNHAVLAPCATTSIGTMTDDVIGAENRDAGPVLESNPRRKPHQAMRDPLGVTTSELDSFASARASAR